MKGKASNRHDPTLTKIHVILESTVASQAGLPVVSPRGGL